MNNHTQNENKIALIMAGGTGGHIFPGIAVAETLISEGWSVHWLGSKGGMEQDLVSKKAIPISLISVAGLRGNGLLGWLKAPFSLIFSVWQGMQVIRKISPSVVIGFGGFASGPGGLASFLMRKKLIIHEQNAVPGLTNKLLSKLAHRVYQAFPNTFVGKGDIQTIGNPIRNEIRNLKTNNADKKDTVLNVLIIGGSRGAQALNIQMPWILSEVAKNGLIEVIHQCGERGLEETNRRYSDDFSSSFEKVKVKAFIDDMAKVYSWADVVICRAGALTVSEIAAVGIAAIFVPFPFAVDDHQTMNARWLVKNDAALLIDQSELSKESTLLSIKTLLNDRPKIKQMAINAKKIAYMDAAQKMSDACNSFFKEVA
ncbi:MAG: undecaprenyldiphospho-muramoylpentapeptide beta-N-acetylglucosaminyltransferase [Kangiellaceae bacterium]|nr:undecaprenyldiphospho-muramoylpentapeptide beta-N-acetylglucosaminyltransferase [Kangiellaceae bacterium]